MSAVSVPFLTASLLAQTPVAEFPFAREDVLGTRLALTVLAHDATEAARVEAAVLAEVERLRRILSSHDADSELMRLQAAGSGRASTDLVAVLAACDRWRAASGGALHPGVQVLTSLWRRAADDGREPAAADLAAAVRRLDGAPWRLAEGGRVEFAMPVCLDALAKGQVLEQAGLAGERAVPGCCVALLVLGGDLRVRGPAARRVAVIDPRQPADNGTPLAVLDIQDRAVASSGGYARGFDIAGRHLSHVFDPHTGRPVEAVLGATAVAPGAADADALATILCVLPPADGLALVERTAGAAAAVVTADGTVHTSKGWAGLVAPTPAPAPDANPRWPAGFELTVEFTIRKPEGGGRGYRRPYVAVWLEDAIGDPACALSLWIQKERWLPDLRRWHRHYRDRSSLVDALSQATRKPGAYSLAWNGLDDDGRALAPGKFTVLIEAAREHGTYQLMRREIEIGDQPFECAVEGNPEIESARIRFGPRVAR